MAHKVKQNRPKHNARVNASRKRSQKEEADRIRLGKPRYPGDDNCGEEHLGYKCRRPAGHGGLHKGYRLDRMGSITWKCKKD